MTAGLPDPDVPAAIADRRVFTSNGVAFTVADIARHGQGGDRGATRTATPHEAEVAFRRARGLLTADRLGAWLEAWAIDADDFVAWTHDTATGSSTATAWCDLVCSGRFETATADVAAAAAAACELGRGPAAGAEFEPAGWVDRLRAATHHESALRTSIAGNRLGWTWISGNQVVAPTRGVCSELRQWIVADGQDLAVAAEAAGCAVLELATSVELITPTEVHRYLAGARPGDIIGPVEAPNGWNLIVVDDRRVPDPRDPAVRARAAELLGAEAVARAVARHIGT